MSGVRRFLVPLLAVGVTVFAAWAIVATILLSKSHKAKVIEHKIMEAPLQTFDLVSVKGPGVWELADDDESLVHLYALWCVNEELGYGAPHTVITSKFRDLAQLMFPSCKVKTSGLGTMRASDAFHGVALPQHHRPFLERLCAAVHAVQVNVTHLEHLKTPHDGDLDVIASVLGASAVVANGPSDLCVLSRNVVDSLGCVHGYNRLICERTGADYVGVKADGTTVHKGDRNVCGLYHKSALVAETDRYVASKQK